MQEKRKVLKLYPLIGIANSYLFETKSNLMRCGAGWINYAIQTDGCIIPCPTMWGMKQYYLGHIHDANPNNLKKILVNNTPCTKCDILNECGGRCLYANITKRWNDQQYSEICITIKDLIQTIKQTIPQIKQLIAQDTISLKDFEYLKYNGCEIIP